MDREAQAAQAVPRTVFCLLETENTPSRPPSSSLSRMRDPGAFQIEMDGPRSVRRNV